MDNFSPTTHLRKNRIHRWTTWSRLTLMLLPASPDPLDLNFSMCLLLCFPNRSRGLWELRTCHCHWGQQRHSHSCSEWHRNLWRFKDKLNFLYFNPEKALSTYLHGTWSFWAESIWFCRSSVFDPWEESAGPNAFAMTLPATPQDSQCWHFPAN